MEGEAQSSLGYQSKILDVLQINSGSEDLVKKTLGTAVDDLGSLLVELQAFHAEFHTRFAPIPSSIVKASADQIAISDQIQSLASALEIGDLSSRFATLRVPAVTPTIAPAVNTPSAQPMIINNFTINDATDPAKVASAVASYLKGVSPWFT